MSATTRPTLVLIPTYNDSECLAEIVDGVMGLPGRFRCLVIDDGSNFPINFEPFRDRALICRLPDNVGIGVCLQIAIGHALTHGYTALVRVDADGQHPIEQLQPLLVPIESDEADVVSGARTNRHEWRTITGIIRTLVRTYFGSLTKLLTKGTSPDDVNTGFVALSSTAIDALHQYRFGRFPEPELFILAWQHKLRIVEIPIEQHARQFGASTIGVIAAIRMVVRFTLFSLDVLLRTRK